MVEIYKIGNTYWISHIYAKPCDTIKLFKNLLYTSQFMLI